MTHCRAVQVGRSDFGIQQVSYVHACSNQEYVYMKVGILQPNGHIYNNKSTNINMKHDKVALMQTKCRILHKVGNKLQPHPQDHYKNAKPQF